MSPECSKMLSAAREERAGADRLVEDQSCHPGLERACISALDAKLQELTEEDVEARMLWSLKYGRVRGNKAGTPLGVTSVDMSLARLKDVVNPAVTKRLVQMNVAS